MSDPEKLTGGSQRFNAWRTQETRRIDQPNPWHLPVTFG